MIFEPMVRLDLHYLQMDQNELPLLSRDLGVPSDASRMIPEPMVCLAQTVHLTSLTVTPSPNGLKQDLT
jgi:hypothetical protein